MSLKTVRRVAADLLKCGTSRVRILDEKRAAESLTREDVRTLIKEKAVVELPKQGVSRGRAREKQSRKNAGRRRGRGSHKGSQYASSTAKSQWMRKVRGQRSALRAFKGRVPNSEYRKAYRMVKGGAFKAKKQLQQHMQEAGKQAQTSAQ